MDGKTPHIVQYQGSKRKLAPQILRYMPQRFARLVEPFSGMAAITMAVAQEKRADWYYVNDINQPLINMLQEAVEHPERLITDYTVLWNEQFFSGDGSVGHYFCVRSRFNSGEHSPALMLYLLARCVKGAVRYGREGNFNQSPDKRRHGTLPSTMAKNIRAVSELLRGRTTWSAVDYHQVFYNTQIGDLIYMDPPYQGVSNVRDCRYYSGVSYEEFVESLKILNHKGVDYLISYDGECDGKKYGKVIPESFGCKKYLLNAGLSTQSTLLGRRAVTYETLYVSQSLSAHIPYEDRQYSMLDVGGAV